MSLLGRGNAEAYGTGDGGIPAYHIHNAGQIGFDFTAGAGYAQAGHNVQKSLGLFGSHGDAVFRSGGNHGDQVHPALAAQRQKLLFFLKGQIGQNQTIHPNFGAGREEALGPIGERHIGVGHEHKRNGHIPAQVPHQIKNLVGGGAGGEGTQVGLLDHRPFGGGVGEGDAQLHQVGPGGGHGPHGGHGGGCRPEERCEARRFPA